MSDRPVILFTTNHPAPYMDNLFNNLNAIYHVKVIYSQKDTGAKQWSPDLVSYPGWIASEISSDKLSEIISGVHLVVAGGWAERIHRQAIQRALSSKKPLAVFSDAPNLSRKHPAIRFIQSQLMNFLPAFFVSGEAAMLEFRKTYRVPERKVRNFPYFPSVDPADCPVELNDQRRVLLTNGSSPVRILIANRFLPRKGYDVVFRALERLVASGSSERVKLTIAGSGVLFEEYSQAIRRVFPEVRFTGWISPQQYTEELSQTDILVHASHFEPYGLPPVEAFLFGKTVVASSGVYSALDLAACSARVHLFEEGDDLKLFEILSLLIDRPSLVYDANDSPVNCRSIAPTPNIRAIEDLIAQ